MNKGNKKASNNSKKLDIEHEQQHSLGTNNMIPIETFLCQDCDQSFVFVAGEPVCPRCRTSDRRKLVVVYLEDDAELEQLHDNDDGCVPD